MELLERERCLADLAEWLATVALHGGCIALIGGEAGIGKTAVLQEFSSRQRIARVLWGACDALFTPRPLAPLHDIARQTQGALLAAINSAANRDDIFAAALDELERAQTLVVFEDMHWADEATLDLLKYFGRRIHRTRAMLAITYRDDEVGPRHPLRSVIGDLPRASRVEWRSRRFQSPRSRSWRERPGGLEGPARHHGRQPALRDGTIDRSRRYRADYRARCRGWPRGQAVTRVTRYRGAGIRRAWPGRTLADRTRSASGSRGNRGMSEHRHGAVARTARWPIGTSSYAAQWRTLSSQPRKQLLHARVLEVLAVRSGISAARLAHHADGARNAEQVQRFAPIAAAQAASVGAHREAASHYKLTLRYPKDLAPEEHAHLLDQLSYELYLTSQHELAIESRRSALEIWRTLGARAKEGDALRWLSRLSWFAGRREEADHYGAEAVAALESLAPSPGLAMAYANRAQLDMEAHETDSAIAWAQRAINLVEPSANGEILSDALNTRGTARLIAGDPLGWGDLERSLQVALAGGFQGQVARAYTNLCAMAVSRRQYGQGAAYLRQGLEYCERYDLDSWWLYLTAYSARMKFEQGDWSGASDDAEAVLRHSRATPVTRIPTLRVLGHLRIRRGDPDASGPLEEAHALAGTILELQRIGTLAAAHAEAAWLAGDSAGVIRAVQPAYELTRQRKDPRMKGELAAWLWRAGALREAPTDIAEPYALEISGDWRDAAQVWNELGCPYEHASLLALHGNEVERLEALTIFERLGAAPAAHALRKQMRAQGVRGVPRGSRPSTRNNPHGLTRREAEILALLSEGLRNAAIAKRLFLSTKTVDHHVSAILTKLGVPSRAQAIATARRQSVKQNSETR